MSSGTTRKVLFAAALLLVAALGLGALALRGEGRRLLALTTADPNALGQVASTSLQPVRVRLETKRTDDRQHTEEEHALLPTPRRVERAVTFEAPAAFITTLDLKGMPEMGGRVGFTVFSESFAPYRPVELASNRLRIAGKSNDEQNAPFAPYADETRLMFEVSNRWRWPDERQALFISRAYYDRRNRAKPCLREVVEDGRFLKLSVPPGTATNDSCQNGPVNAHNAYTLLRLNADGSYAYVVQCDPGGPPGRPYVGGNCRMYDYFDGWPVYTLVNRGSQDKWDTWRERIVRFLREARHPTTNRPDDAP